MVATRSGSGGAVSPFTFTFLVCFVLLCFAEYLQQVDGLDPCPWCIAQRLVYIAIGLVSLAAALWRPGRTGTMIYSVFGILLSIAGVTAASYHVYLQNDPERAMSCMGSWLEQTLDATKIGHFIPSLLQYDGSCEAKPWSFLTLSIPAWSGVWFGILLITFIVILVKARRS